MKGLSDLFWLFFILMAIQPIIRQKMLEAARQRLIAKLEREYGSRIILLVHRQETMALLGVPIFRYIDIQDSEEVMRAIRLTEAEAKERGFPGSPTVLVNGRDIEGREPHAAGVA